MSVAKIIEISAESPQSFDAAIQEGARKASESVKNLKNLWVKDQEVVLKDSGEVDRYRVHMKATFALK